MAFHKVSPPVTAKRAYGMDSTGEVTKEKGTSMMDTDQPQDGFGKMPTDVVNSFIDSKAIKEFPFLKSKSNVMPSRSS